MSVNNDVRYIHRAWGGYTVMGDLTLTLDKPAVIVLPKSSTVARFNVNPSDNRYNLRFNIELTLGCEMEERMFIITADPEKHERRGLLQIVKDVEGVKLVEVRNPTLEHTEDLKFKVTLHEGDKMSHVTNLSVDEVKSRASRLKGSDYMTVKRMGSDNGRKA